MQCNGCQYPHSEVVYTRHDGTRNMITRRRQCLRCGLRFTTKEGEAEKTKPNDDRFPREQHR